ncbi:carboxymuconolactone decarboxylase family protein [Chitinophaga sp. 212800010-3]|uniref:carboxymuconolactone decarboxylase family protein n=1 Tax=unclassified Chitinophaga TaxID=2619133 RepID=UPI002E0F54EA
MNYKAISKDVIGHMYQAHNSLRKSGLDEQLIALVELRVSQLNGCAYCCRFHAGELRAWGVDAALLDQLPGWKLAAGFTERQQLALQWADALTLMEGDLPATRRQLESVFTEKELVDLTASISLMNALNRLRITLGDHDY